MKTFILLFVAAVFSSTAFSHGIERGRIAQMDRIPNLTTELEERIHSAIIDACGTQILAAGNATLTEVQTFADSQDQGLVDYTHNLKIEIVQQAKVRNLSFTVKDYFISNPSIDRFEFSNFACPR